MVALETTEAQLWELERVRWETSHLEVFYQEVSEKFSLAFLGSVFLLASPDRFFLKSDPDLVSHLHFKLYHKEKFPESVTAPGCLASLGVWAPLFLWCNLEVAVFRPPAAIGS